jgi:hypothetical protein
MINCRERTVRDHGRCCRRKGKVLLKRARRCQDRIIIQAVSVHLEGNLGLYFVLLGVNCARFVEVVRRHAGSRIAMFSRGNYQRRYLR